MLHEALHSFGAHLSFRHPRTGRTESLRDRDFCQCHWSPHLFAPALHPAPLERGLLSAAGAPRPARSLMGGALYRDNGDGTFTREADGGGAGLSALDLYTLGLLAPEEVPDTFLLENVQELGGGRCRADKVQVRARDIVAAMGPRDPPSARAPRSLRLGVYLLFAPGRGPDAVLRARAEAVAAELTALVAALTGGRMRWTLGR